MKKFLLAIPIIASLLLFSSTVGATQNSAFIKNTAFIGGSSSVERGINSAKAPEQPSVLFGNGSIFERISSMLLFLIGVLSVIMLIIGGFKYVLSGGNKDAVASAKNTILYAIIGLIVALLAYAVIRFVVGMFTGGTIYSSEI